ncbi:TrkH family potassium uptake protein [Candidatus Paracaedibacter symbiosus]|uniref:TrkH family potassium uptake protein n=1 Tax=Candidatus Paracaedibacter symbiosus TaxID=244582 RepID=UPI00050983CE|nr:TrkH family potassium uptake protein [Candidatus Paracaedibacter symbiosus]
MLAFRPVLYLIGILISIFAVAMLLPLILELLVFKTDGWQEFGFGAFFAGSLGPLLALANYSPEKIELRVREAFLLTTLSWVATSVFAAFPMYWSSLNLSFIDAWFESVSALTTTGSTVITYLDNAPKGVLLWRSLLQWLGGTGIILMALTILPILRIGGMQLFRSEFSDRSEKILPRVSQISSAILSVYLLFSVLCFLSLKLAGMDYFDAVCHTMATVSTGGLSTHNASLGFYNDFLIETITIIFMIIGGITYILYIKLWQGNFKAIYKDSQLRVFLCTMLIAGIGIALWNWQQTELGLGKSLREGVFTAVSIMTSTGFTTIDYTQWASFPLFIVFILSIIGGCTGSTSGGLKVFRLQVLSAAAHVHLKQLRRQYGVYVPTYQNQKISEAVAMSVLTFVSLYFLVALVIVALLTLFNLDIVNAFSAAIAAISNTGPGITELIGPSGTHAPLPDACKLILMAGMILGRLEILTVFVLFMPSFWRS